MQFRCYMCGLKFGDGPPPLEALSPAQASLVGIERQDSDVLDGTMFEGRFTPYNFCAFCLTYIRITGVYAGQDVPGHELLWPTGFQRSEHSGLVKSTLMCSCSDLPLLVSISRVNEHTFFNRAWRMHQAFVLGFSVFDLTKLLRKEV